MTKLLLTLEDGTLLQTADLPQSILDSLAAGNEIAIQYTGWGPQGFLTSARTPNTLSTRKNPDVAIDTFAGLQHEAGQLNICLTNNVDDPHDPGFIPYGAK